MINTVLQFTHGRATTLLETNMTFAEQIKTELHEMVLLKLISSKKHIKASLIVDNDPATFDEDSGMSVTEAADLAVELC